MGTLSPRPEWGRGDWNEQSRNSPEPARQWVHSQLLPMTGRLLSSSSSSSSKPSFASKYSLVTRCFTTWRRRRSVAESRFWTGGQYRTEIWKSSHFKTRCLKHFEKIRLLNSYSFEDKTYLGCLRYFDFDCNPYFEPRSSTTSRAWIWVLGFRLVDSPNTW